ncbi:MAG: CRISPR-associated endonuclease Cas2 [Phycisphaerales bacterium]|nr:CRISPR-associated endonuclease Cas2 [Phycisphaerales bacterium]
MHVLVTYDVNTTDKDGRRRLRRVARVCENWGQRVQASVFECKVSPHQYATLKARLAGIIDERHDSLRFYMLGSTWGHRVEKLGLDRSYDPDGPLIA